MDVPFALMGLSFIAMAVGEYMFPAGAGGERAVVKVLNGGQVVFALIAALFSMTPGALTSRIAVSFLSLFFYLCISGIINVSNPAEALYLRSMYLYWYAMFLFFYLRSRMHPDRQQDFVVPAVCSLLVWVPALIHFTRVNATVNASPFGMQVQNYMGYYIIALFPHALLLKKKSLKILAFSLISFGSVYSLKRGAVLALCLMGLSASLIYCTVLSTTGKRIRNVVILFLLWGVAMTSGALYVYANSDTVTRRIESDTGRSRIYSITWEAIENADFFKLIIGHGDRQSRIETGHEPHNDWLLLLYDYGFIGVMLMLNIYICLAGELWKAIRLRSALALPLASSLVLLMCVQAYSTGLYIKTFGFIAGSIGLIMGRFHAEYKLYRTEAGRRIPNPSMIIRAIHKQPA